MEYKTEERELAEKKLDLITKVFFYEDPKKKMLKAFLFFLGSSVLAVLAYSFGSTGFSFALGILSLVFVIRAIEAYREIQ